MTLNQIYEKVAQDTNLPKDIVAKIYKAYWKSIREYMMSMPFKEDLSDEEFKKLRPNVNIHSIGKLYVTLDRYRKIKYLQKIRKEQRDAAHQKG